MSVCIGRISVCVYLFTYSEDSVEFPHAKQCSCLALSGLAYESL